MTCENIIANIEYENIKELIIIKNKTVLYSGNKDNLISSSEQIIKEFREKLLAENVASKFLLDNSKLLVFLNDADSCNWIKTIDRNPTETGFYHVVYSDKTQGICQYSAQNNVWVYSKDVAAWYPAPPKPELSKIFN